MPLRSKRRPTRKPLGRRWALRSPVEVGALSVNWKLAAFLIPALSLIGAWFVMRYQVGEAEKRLNDHEARIRQMEAQNQNAQVFDYMRKRQDEMFVDVTKIKARLGID